MRTWCTMHLDSVLTRLGIELDAENMRKATRMLFACSIAIAPMILASLAFPDRVVVLVVLVTSWTLVYPQTAKLQEDLFALPLKPTHVIVAWPLTLLLVAWSFLLLVLERKPQIGATVFPALVLLLCAIAPLYRRAKSTRTKRLLPYRYIYILGASLVFVVEVTILWGLS